MKNTEHISAWLILILMFWITGCHEDIEDIKDIKEYCKERNDCYEGNEADEEACIEEMKAMEDVADAYDCGDEFDSMISCFADTGSCSEAGSSQNGSRSEASEYAHFHTACWEKEQALSECIEDASSVD